MKSHFLTKILCLAVAAVLLISSTLTVTAADNAVFSVYATGGEVCTLTVYAPTTVKAGENFELVFKWNNYVLKSGYPSAFAIEFAFDTRYIVLESPCDSCVTLEETTKEWIDACNYGDGKDLGGVEALDKTKPNMQVVNISFATAEFDDGVKNTFTARVKFKAVYDGVAEFEWIYAQFADMSFETAVDCDMSTAALSITVGDEKTDPPLKTPEPGDVNDDGKINTLDAAMVLKSNIMLIKLEDEQAKLGDVNRDGKVDSLDAAAILKYDLGVINKF